MSYLNQIFDKIYCINLDKRTDRWASVSQQFTKFGIEVERVPAVDGSLSEIKSNYISDGELGIILSNIFILNHAKQNKYKSILIFEDDIIFSDEINNIQKYFSALSGINCDMLWLSGNHNLHVQGIPAPIEVNEKLFKISNTFSAHAVGIRQHMFDVILDRIEAFEKPLDVYYADLQKEYNCYCFKGQSPLVTQASGYSNIQNKEVDYNWLIK